MKKYLSVALALILVCCSLPFAAAKDAGELRFRSDGTFRILQLSDTQDDAYPAENMLELVRRSIEFSDPDLIVISGDLVEDSRIGDVNIDKQPGREGVNVENLKGELDAAKTRANVEKAVDAVFSEIEKYEVPYVIALGNNDRKVGLTGADWLEIFAKYPHCIAFDESSDAQDGVDYHVTVKGTDGADKLNVWLLDTCRGGISDEQVDWYRETSQAITAANGGEPVPALAFQHIQIAEIGNLFEPCRMTDEGAKKAKQGFVRLNKEIANGHNVFSYEPGGASYEFAAFKECGDVMGLFFGHQHVEGFSGVWDGIELGFTYGCEMAKTGPYGFRVFTLREDDVRDYENVLYRYTGSAAAGNVRISPEENRPYTADFGNIFAAAILKTYYFLAALVSVVMEAFR